MSVAEIHDSPVGVFPHRAVIGEKEGGLERWEWLMAGGVRGFGP